MVIPNEQLDFYWSELVVNIVFERLKTFGIGTDIEGLRKFATQCSSYVTILIGIKALEGFISPYQN
jgi:hypothetical protein